MDPYIDNHEAVLYGQYFFQHCEPLIGASRVIDVEVLRELVMAKAQAIENGMTLVDTPKSDVRAGRDEVEERKAELVDRLRRFHRFLLSLPASASVDVAAFFADGKLGKISKDKPEEILTRANTVMRGFTTRSGARVPNGAEWQADILVARTSLHDALQGKLGAANTATTSGGSLALAREEFLHVYNKVAKRAIRALLAELGREHELRIYFRDMQVSGSRTRLDEPGDEPAGDEPGVAPTRP
ncbi:MAG TPA: hypothetical protein VNM90_01020 [Haliangium sp.]|nr:hypothetical protein [Haliangium sp.]